MAVAIAKAGIRSAATTSGHSTGLRSIPPTIIGTVTILSRYVHLISDYRHQGKVRRSPADDRQRDGCGGMPHNKTPGAVRPPAPCFQDTCPDAGTGTDRTPTRPSCDTRNMTNYRRLLTAAVLLIATATMGAALPECLPACPAADLRDVDLRSADLQGAVLTGADLAGALLVNADLSHADLIDANLEGASLTGATLRNAILRDANLAGADFIGANLVDADLRRANLTGADLRAASLIAAIARRATLHMADLRNAALSGADFSEANLHGAALQGAALNEADLSGSNLTNATLEGAHGCDSRTRPRPRLPDC